MTQVNQRRVQDDTHKYTGRHKRQRATVGNTAGTDWGRQDHMNQNRIHSHETRTFTIKQEMQTYIRKSKINNTKHNTYDRVRSPAVPLKPYLSETHIFHKIHVSHRQYYSKTLSFVPTPSPYPLLVLLEVSSRYKGVFLSYCSQVRARRDV